MSHCIHVKNVIYQLQHIIAFKCTPRVAIFITKTSRNIPFLGQNAFSIHFCSNMKLILSLIEPCTMKKVDKSSFKGIRIV